MIERGLYYRMANATTLTTLIATRPGNTSSPGIYPSVAEQGAALPYVIYSKVSDVPNYSYAREYGYRKARFQINCFADRYNTVRDIREGLRNVLSGWKGTTPTESIKSIFFENERDILGATDTGTEEPIFGVTIDAMVQYIEATQPSLPS